MQSWPGYEIVYPVLVADGSPPVLQYVLRTYEDAQHTLEAWDIEGGDYLAWDAHGRRLVLTEKLPFGSKNWLSVHLLDVAPEVDVGFLEKLIVDHARLCGVLIVPQPGESLIDLDDRADSLIRDAIIGKQSENSWWRRFFRFG